jgi:hypothetical protein
VNVDAPASGSPGDGDYANRNDIHGDHHELRSNTKSAAARNIAIMQAANPNRPLGSHAKTKVILNLNQAWSFGAASGTGTSSARSLSISGNLAFEARKSIAAGFGRKVRGGSSLWLTIVGTPLQRGFRPTIQDAIIQYFPAHIVG